MNYNVHSLLYFPTNAAYGVTDAVPVVPAPPPS
eukprot:COSAG06_NODE_57432_length_280_cov_0.856354_1_plen_32_part_10